MLKRKVVCIMYTKYCFICCIGMNVYANCWTNYIHDWCSGHFALLAVYDYDFRSATAPPEVSSIPNIPPGNLGKPWQKNPSKFGQSPNYDF